MILRFSLYKDKLTLVWRQLAVEASNSESN